MLDGRGRRASRSLALLGTLVNQKGLGAVAEACAATKPGRRTGMRTGAAAQALRRLLRGDARLPSAALMAALDELAVPARGCSSSASIVHA